MKVREDIKKLTTSQSNLAKCLGLTQPRINQLIEEGVVVRDDKDNNGGVMLFQSIKNYFQSKNVTDDGIDFWAEKAKRECVNRKRDALKLKKEEGAVYDAKAVELAFIELLTILRTQLLGLPSKFAVQLEGKKRDAIYQLMTTELEDKLAEMAAYDPKSLSGELENSSSAG